MVLYKNKLLLSIVTREIIMKTKSDLKRNQILDIAANLFIAKGYDQVSMAELCAQVGGSKATLYSHFKSKEDLFVEVIYFLIQKITEAVSFKISAEMSLRDKLYAIGIEYLKLSLSGDWIGLTRNLIAQGNTNLSNSASYEKGVKYLWQHVEDLIAAAIHSGELKPEEPKFAAMQLRKLFELDLLERRLLNVVQEASKTDIEKNVSSGLAMFFSYYGNVVRNVG